MRGGFHLQAWHVRLREDLRAAGPENGLPRRVIGVVVRVHEIVELTRRRAGIDRIEARLGRRGKLRIDDDDALAIDMPADRAALTRERADGPAQGGQRIGLLCLFAWDAMGQQCTPVERRGGECQ